MCRKPHPSTGLDTHSLQELECAPLVGASFDLEDSSIEVRPPVGIIRPAGKEQKAVGAAVAFLAVLMVAFEGTMLRYIQGQGVECEIFQFWVCSGKGLVQLAFVLGQKRGSPCWVAPISPVGWLCLGVSAFAGFATTELLQAAGRQTTAIEMFGIFYMYPLFCAALAALLLREQMPLASWMTFAFVLACLLPMLWHAAFVPPPMNADGTNPQHLSSLSGDLLALLASVSFGAHLVASRFMSVHAPRVPVPLALCGGMIAGALVQCPKLVLSGRSFFDGVTGPIWAVLFIYSVTGGGYYTLLTYAVSLTSVRHVSMIAMLDVALGPAVTSLVYPETTEAWITRLNEAVAAALVLHEAWLLYSAREARTVRSAADD